MDGHPNPRRDIIVSTLRHFYDNFIETERPTSNRSTDAARSAPGDRGESN